MGMFIHIDVNDAALSPPVRAALVGVCPVNIFMIEGERLAAGADQMDECTLCELCLEVAPAAAIRICRTYSNKVLVSRGPGSGEQQQH